MKIQPGEIVVAILQNPREKLVGVLSEIGSAGIFLRGIDLLYFDEWTRAIANDEPHLPIQDYFIPMWRVERITRDEGTDEMPSMSRILHQRTGHEFGEF